MPIGIIVNGTIPRCGTNCPQQRARSVATPSPSRVSNASRRPVNDRTMSIPGPAISGPSPKDHSPSVARKLKPFRARLAADRRTRLCVHVGQRLEALGGVFAAPSEGPTDVFAVDGVFAEHHVLGARRRFAARQCGLEAFDHLVGGLHELLQVGVDEAIEVAAGLEHPGGRSSRTIDCPAPSCAPRGAERSRDRRWSWSTCRHR